MARSLSTTAMVPRHLLRGPRSRWGRRIRRPEEGEISLGVEGDHRPVRSFPATSITLRSSSAPATAWATVSRRSSPTTTAVARIGLRQAVPATRASEGRCNLDGVLTSARAHSDDEHRGHEPSDRSIQPRPRTRGEIAREGRALRPAPDRGVGTYAEQRCWCHRESALRAWPRGQAVRSSAAPGRGQTLRKQGGPVPCAPPRLSRSNERPRRGAAGQFPGSDRRCRWQGRELRPC